MIGRIHTSCKDCIFAIYTGMTQQGCKLGELAFFIEHNVEILEAYNEEKNFYIINNNKCLKFRPETWIHNDKNLLEQKEQVNKEIAIHYHAIIFANSNLEDIKITLDSLYKQELQPKYITIVRERNNTLKPSEIYPLFVVKDGSEKSHIKWRMENPIGTRTREEIIDTIIPFVKVPIYAVFNAGFNMPLDLFSSINEKIHNMELNLIMVTPEENGSGLIVSQKIHEAYQGNFNGLLIDKLQQDNCPHICTFYDLLNRLKRHE